MSTRIRRGAVLLLAVVALLGLTKDTESAEGVNVSIERIEMPVSIAAGESADVHVHGPDMSVGLATIVVRSGAMTVELGVAIEDGSGVIALPSVLTQKAGKMVAASQGGVAATMTIDPAPVAGMVTPLVGPRTIVADGVDRSMAVVIPVDQFGNHVADQTPLDIEWTQPDSRVTTSEQRVIDGIAWAPIPAGVVSGPTTVGAFSQGIAGPRVRILETPGRAATVEMTELDGTYHADGRSIVLLETSEVLDSHANTLEDGTIGQFVVESETGAHLVHGVIQNGVMRSSWRAPARPGTVSIHAEVNGVVSPDIGIDFEPAVSEIPVNLHRVDNELVLVVGPVTSNDGSFVADGTSVIWGGEHAQLRLGFAEFTVDGSTLTAEIPPVSILGVSHAVEDAS